MTLSDRLALVILIAAMFLAGPAAMALLQQGEQRAPVASPLSPPYGTWPGRTATPLRTPTTRPTLGPSPWTETPTPMWLDIPTPNVWRMQPEYRALTPLPERTAVAWLARVGQP